MVYQCRKCGKPLEVVYDTKAIAEKIERSDLCSRRIYSMWRYFELLPVDFNKAVSLGEGFTPLLKAEGISKALGAENLYLKLDFNSPLPDLSRTEEAPCWHRRLRMSVQ